MTADQIKHMTERFLSWKLPSSFAPDGGVARTERFSEHTSGTNVFDYMQAQAMIQHMLEGLPSNHIVNFENEVDYIGVKMESLRIAGGNISVAKDLYDWIVSKE
jgi:L-rhamnose isomerase